jgi:purine-nucleoside phosphorylase
MEDLYQAAITAAEFIKKKTSWSASTAIILGTGLGDLSENLTEVQSIPYHEIPHFPVSTIISHKGELLAGIYHNTPVWVLSGRFHYYEGYSAQLASFPIRVLKLLGIENLIITNASGSVNPNFLPGDMVIIKDHINLHPDNPLRGYNDERFGPRFPDMSNAYCPYLIQKFEGSAKNCNIEKINKGVYVGVQGPNLETPAEYRMFNIIGADIVGMSTIPEVLAAQHMSIKILAVAIVTNLCYPPEKVRFTPVEEIIKIANLGAFSLKKVLFELLKSPL